MLLSDNQSPSPFPATKELGTAATVAFLGQQPTADEQVDVLILGAGMAGVAAAAELYKAGARSFLVLEGSDRVGGRMKQISFAGRQIEAGANWISGALPENPVYRMAQDTAWLGSGRLQAQDAAWGREARRLGAPSRATFSTSMAQAVAGGRWPSAGWRDAAICFLHTLTFSESELDQQSTPTGQAVADEPPKIGPCLMMNLMIGQSPRVLLDDSTSLPCKPRPLSKNGDEGTGRPPLRRQRGRGRRAAALGARGGQVVPGSASERE